MTDKHEEHVQTEHDDRAMGGAPNHQTEFEGPPPGVRAMALFRWILIATMGVIAALSVTYSFGFISADSANAASTQYYCPMHPQVVQDHPGECPICSMTLVPKPRSGQSSSKSATEGKEPVSHAGHRHNPSDPYYCPMHPEETGTDASARCPICEMKMEKRPREPKGTRVDPMQAPSDGGTPAPQMQMAEPAQALSATVPGLVPVELTMDRVQLIGVRTAPATTEPLVPELRAVGFVTRDEAKLARVHTRFSGWIEQLAVATTGQEVRPGQLLASIFNLELLPAQQEFLAARRWNTDAGSKESSATPSTLRTSLEQDARTRLELLGMSPAEIQRIAETGKPTRTVSVSAPIGGYVVRKNAVVGTYVQPGTELFEIADLSKIWVLADIYEYEIGRVSIGQAAYAEFGSYPGERFPAKLGFIYPTVDSATRTIRVRLVLDNNGLKLRPGMYGDVVIQLEHASGVVVPKEAFVDTGEYQYVFVAKDGGRFEPRRVRAGARSGDKVQILEGLAAGETVVSTGNFLIDSESRLRAAIEGPSGGAQAEALPSAASACDKDFDKAKFPDKYEQCRQCERVHRGMGTMEEDCKKAILRPWR